MSDDRFAGESVELYRSALEALCDAFVIEDTSRRVIACNERAAHILGLSRDELLKPVPFDARFSMVREDGAPLPQSHNPVARAFATGEPQDLVTLGIVQPGGRTVWLRGTSRPLFRGGEREPHAVVSAFTDVSGERSLHTSIDDREQAIARARAIIEILYDAIPDYVFLKDTEGRYRAANLATCEYLGLPLERILGRADHELVDAETASAFRAQDLATLQKGTPQWTEDWLVYRDGRRVLVETKKRPMYDKEGALIGVLAVARDITARKKAEDELAAYKADLERLVAARSSELLKSRDELTLANLELHKAMRAKDAFLATMSHELRTPLSSMLMISEAVQEGVYGPLGERQKQALTTLDQSGRRLSSLIADILDLARIGAGALGVEPVACDANAIAKRAITRVGPIATRRGITIEEAYGSPSIEIHADPRRLEQILVNLLDNAVKFTPRAGRVGMEVAADRRDGVIRFAVWDTGPGISPEEQEKLFQPFTQLDSRLSRGHAGSGLGLALVRALVGLHGGRVSLASRTSEPCGSRFMVALPWAAPP